MVDRVPPGAPHGAVTPHLTLVPIPAASPHGTAGRAIETPVRDGHDGARRSTLSITGALVPIPQLTRPVSVARPADPPARVTLSGSVGRDGDNLAADVAQVQAFLVRANHLDAAAFTSGTMNPATIEAIVRYQREAVGLRRPDGRVDPDQNTIATMNGERAPRLRRSGSGSPARRSTAIEGVVPSADDRHYRRDELVGPAPDAPNFRTPGRTGPVSSTETMGPTTERLIDGAPASGMTPAQAYAELDRLGIPYRRTTSPGVADAVRIDYPLLGVAFPYVDRYDRTTGLPTRMFPREHATLDVRLVVGLAHMVQQVREQGRLHGWELVNVNNIGGHVLIDERTTPSGEVVRTLHTGQHARGLAMDLHSFTFRDASGREFTLSLPGHWGTARSTRSSHHGDANLQSAEEIAGMSPNEVMLRQIWGFLRTEFDLVVTPSHNYGHTNHFHPQLTSIGDQDRRSRESLAAYLAAHPDVHTAGDGHEH